MKSITREELLNLVKSDSNLIDLNPTDYPYIKLVYKNSDSFIEYEVVGDDLTEQDADWIYEKLKENVSTT